MVLIGGSFYFGLASPMLSLDLPFAGYFRHDHVFLECHTGYFMVNITEMLTHACAIGTRPLFSPPSPPGYEATKPSDITDLYHGLSGPDNASMT